MRERTTCPRRTNELGPWERGEGLDMWVRDRWGGRWQREFVYWWVNHSPVQRAVRAYHAWGWEFWRRRGTPLHQLPWRVFRRSLNWSNLVSGGTKWPWPWQPRTCSFCGGINPDDAIALVSEGWEIETTGKSYKRYLEPPGYHVHSRAFIDDIRSGALDGLVAPKRNLSYSSPVPPVKLYIAHFNDQQIDAFNLALRHGIEAVPADDQKAASQ